ncbi:MAG: glycerol-3-phosphate acyltransferase [Clostridia bacterium]|nr:glycerol-3-phosphate acyltransferase [Clostridia bacterium]
MSYCVVILMGYLMGCSNMAVYLAKAKGVNLREGGSGNLGASNAAILMGWRAAVLVAIHDIGKALAAVILARLLFADAAFIGVVAGVAAVLGHIFPVFMKFRGGKGFASFIGMMFAIDWMAALVLLGAAIALTVITDYLVLGTTLTVIGFPVWEAIGANRLLPALVILVVSVVIIVKHRKNYVRIWNRTEIGLRSTVKGEHKVK